jgi:hypothetical protein
LVRVLDNILNITLKFTPIPIFHRKKRLMKKMKKAHDIFVYVNGNKVNLPSANHP